MQDRILQIMKNYGLNAGQFAEKIGVQPSNVSHILAGRNKPSLDFVSKVLQEFPNIDYQWLIFGKGSMLKNTTEDINLFSETAIKNTEPKIKNTNTPIKKEKNITSNFEAMEIKEKEQDVISKEKTKETVVYKEKRINKIIVFFNDGTYEER